jgi:cytidylate kinase
MTSFFYKNITISGGVASGKGTLAKNLTAYLSPLGWKNFSGSDLAHKFAPEYYNPSHKDAKRTHHSATAYDDDTDREIDRRITMMLEKEEKIIVDSWLAGFNARHLPHTLRVLLICSQKQIVIERIVNRDLCSIAEAKIHLQKRNHDNFTKWQRLYGKYDFFDPKFYTLVIDTYSSGPLETMGKVLDALYSPKA